MEEYFFTENTLIVQSDLVSNITNVTLDEPELVSYYRHSTLATVILVVAYSGVAIVGVPGNAIVICVLSMKRQMKTVTNVFILNLAVADSLVLIVCIFPTLVGNIFTPWLLGSFLCKAVAYVQGVSVCASVYSLVAISLDRFRAILFPTTMPRGLSKRQAWIIACCIWIFAGFITLPWLIVFQVVPSGIGNEEYCLEEWADPENSKTFFIVCNLILCYGLPLTIIAITNFLIWRHVAKRNLRFKNATPPETQRVHRKSLKGVIKMLSVVTFAFLISWLPLYMIFLRLKLGGPVSEDSEVMVSIFVPIAQWLGASNSCVNPIIYSFMNDKFRDVLKSFVQWPWGRKPTVNEQSLTCTYIREYKSSRKYNKPQICSHV